MNQKSGRKVVIRSMSWRRALMFCIALIGFGAGAVVSAATTLTIGVPNNNDQIELKKLSPAFEKANPDIRLKWVVLEENVLRQRLTTDITTNGGQFDVLAIGTYEAPVGQARMAGANYRIAG